jgi:hypothetical protein
MFYRLSVEKTTVTIQNMDARTVAELARIGVGTLNVWVQRGLIPGMSTGARGRQREFDDSIAIDVLIIAELVRLGWSAPLASAIASQRGAHNYLLVANSEMARGFGPMPVNLSPETAEIVGFESEAGLSNALTKFRGGVPSIYLTININKVMAGVEFRLQQHVEWVRAGRPLNWLSVPFPSPSTPIFPPEEAEKSPEPVPAPSKPPARRQRRKKTQ